MGEETFRYIGNWLDAGASRLLYGEKNLPDRLKLLNMSVHESTLLPVE